jgi:flagellar basal-body rod modification protein FlgD
MSSITPVNTLIQAPPNSRIPAKTMTQDDFMKVLLVQLQNQDPLKPQDGNQMLQQMGQIQNIQSMLSMQDSITQSRRDGQMTLGQSLMGKSVKVVDNENKPFTGIVKEVRIEGKNVMLQLDSGASYPITNLVSVLTTPAA